MSRDIPNRDGSLPKGDGQNSQHPATTNTSSTTMNDALPGLRLARFEDLSQFVEGKIATTPTRTTTTTTMGNKDHTVAASSSMEPSTTKAPSVTTPKKFHGNLTAHVVPVKTGPPSMDKTKGITETNIAKSDGNSNHNNDNKDTDKNRSNKEDNRNNNSNHNTKDEKMSDSRPSGSPSLSDLHPTSELQGRAVDKGSPSSQTNVAILKKRTHSPSPSSSSSTSSSESVMSSTSTSKRKKTRSQATKRTRTAATKTKLQSKWDDMFNRLVRYKTENGHCLVPNRYENDPALGSWVSTQRRQYKILKSGGSESTPMTPERARRLMSIGFVWATTDPRHTPWQARYEQLKEFVIEHGECVIVLNECVTVCLCLWQCTGSHAAESCCLDIPRSASSRGNVHDYAVTHMVSDIPNSIWFPPFVLAS